MLGQNFFKYFPLIARGNRLPSNVSTRYELSGTILTTRNGPSQLGDCRNSGTWGSPDAVKVGPPHVGPPRRHSRPPHLPHSIPTHAASTNKAKNPGTLRGPLDPKAGVEVPGTPTPGRRPGSSPGTNLQRTIKISLPAPA